MPCWARPSGRGAVVVPQYAAETFVLDDLAGAGLEAVDQLVVEALMGSFVMIVRDVVADGLVEHRCAEEDHLVQTLVLDRSHPTLGEGVHVGSLNTGADDVDARMAEDLAEGIGELRVSIDDEETLVAKGRRRRRSCCARPAP